MTRGYSVYQHDARALTCQRYTTERLVRIKTLLTLGVSFRRAAVIPQHRVYNRHCNNCLATIRLTTLVVSLCVAAIGWKTIVVLKLPKHKNYFTGGAKYAYTTTSVSSHYMVILL